MHSAPHTQPHDPTPGGSDPDSVAAILAANPDGHEHGDVQLTGVVVFAISFVVVMILVFVGLYAALLGWNKVNGFMKQGPQPIARNLVPPEPRLQPEEGLHESLPYQDMRAQRAYEDMVLSSYGWANSQHTILRMPINVAMEQAVQQGLPATLPPVGLQNTNQKYDPNVTQYPLPRNIP